MKKPAWSLPPDLKSGGNDQAGSQLATTPEPAYWVMGTQKACRIDFEGGF